MRSTSEAQNKEGDDAAKKIAEAEAEKNKMEETRKLKQQRAKEAIKNKRAKAQLAKDNQALRDEHEKKLILLRQHADEEIQRLKSSVVDAEAGPSAAGALGFPEDPIDEINSQTPPVRLSQEEMEQSSQDFNQFQRMIYKHIGQRLKKRPKKYISPFKLPGYRPNVPLTKALALRNKIAADPALKE